MIQLSSILFNRPVMSLRTGGEIGKASRPLINPNNLKIEGWFVNDAFSKQELILPSSELREMSKIGLIVDDHEAMTDKKDLVRLQKIIEINFELVGKKVKTDQGAGIGKVSDFSFEQESLVVQKLYVSSRGFGGLTGQEKIIGRQQIVKITDQEIIVRDSTVKAPILKRVLNPLKFGDAPAGPVSADTKSPSRLDS